MYWIWQVQYDPCCPTYKMLGAPVKTFGSSCVAIRDHLFLIGGYFCLAGNEVNVVFSSQILKKKFGSHAMVTTETATYAFAPQSHRQMWTYSLKEGIWTELSKVPFDLADPAVTEAKGKIYVIGGFALKISADDPDLLYFEPQKSVWIWDLVTKAWERGPDLPGEGSAKGSAYLGKIVY